MGLEETTMNVRKQVIRAQVADAKWVTVGGKKFYSRSKWERNFARYLDFLQIHGEISEWLHEPKVFWFPEKRGVTNYKPDFCTLEKSTKLIYYEVKGWMDPKSRTKLNRMAKHHPKIHLRLIDADWFQRNNKKLKFIIMDWER